MRPSMHDAFVVPLLCGEIGIPFIGMELLRLLGPVEGALADAVAGQAATYRSNLPTIASYVLEVDRILNTYQLPTLPRPTTFAEYTAWADAACRAVLASTGPNVPEGALAALGRAVVGVLEPIGLGAMVLHLRAVAGTHEGLRVEDEHLLNRLREGVRQLDAMSKFSTLPEMARDDAGSRH